MQKSKRFAIVVNLGTGMLNLSIAHAVVTFWPEQNPDANVAATAFSADDGWKVRRSGFQGISNLTAQNGST